MKVAIGDVDLQAAQQTAKEIGGPTHPSAVALPLDVTDRASFAAFLDTAEEQLGPLDILINNAGIMPLGRFVDEDDLTAQRMIDINLHGVILGMKLGARADGPARPRSHRQHRLAGRQVRRARAERPIRRPSTRSSACPRRCAASCA